jgi:hypothetical protein
MMRTPTRRPRSAIALALAAATGTAGLATWVATTPPAVAAASATSPLAVAGRGATVGFTEYEAEDAATNGSVLGMNRTAGTLAGEASGRRAVQLTGAGKYVEFTLTRPANAIDVRYSLPDSPTGTGITAPIALYLNGAKNRDLTLTSKYSWYYGSYPFTNNPGDGKQHHLYDETRALLGSTLAAGTKVRLQVDNAAASSYTIDLADFEQVGPAASRPANSLSVADYGADPNGAAEASNAFDAAISAARSQGKEVWIPPGTFTINRHIIVDNVTVRGAGPWYSVLHGNGVGLYGNYAPNPSGNVKLYDFAILGEVQERNDGAQVNGVGGALGGGSVVQNLWIQHTKVGLWLDGPFDGLTIRDNRILDQTADGLNLHNGISHVTVTNNFVRNAGDDGLAMWSDQNADHDNVFSFNTIVAPILANNIAIYGGRDNSVTDNVVSETQTQGGGLHVGNRFNSVPLAGTTTLARNTTLRAGVLDPNWQFGVGALWFYALDAPMTGTINVTDTDLLDSSYEAVHFIGNGISNVNLTNVRIDGAGTFAVQLQSTGSARFANVTAAHIGGPAGIYNCQGAGAFTIADGGGNGGWNTTYCGQWPDPVYTYPGPGPGPSPTASPTVSPSPTPSPTPPPGGNLALRRPVTVSSTTQAYAGANAVDGDANTYWESANNAFPQTLTVDLGASSALSKLTLKLPPSSAWGTRTQTLSVSGSTDGSAYSTLAGSAGYTFDPAGGNTVTVPVNGTARYVRLTFTANTGWAAGQLSELEVYGGSSPPPPPPAGNLALRRPVTVSSATQTYAGANAVDGDAASYWESANNAFPQALTVDLGSSAALKRVVLRLPPSSAWSTRTQTLSASGSTDGSAFSTLAGSAGYTFDPASGNAVTIAVGGTARYVRLTFTANTGWPAGQLSELEAYAS